MSDRLKDTPLDVFSGNWSPSWTGLHRVAVVTELEKDPSQFVACGTDGTAAFRVLGRSDELPAFTGLMLASGAQILPAPPEIVLPYGEVIINPPTIPSCNAVQRLLDAAIAQAKAA